MIRTLARRAAMTLAVLVCACQSPPENPKKLVDFDYRLKHPLVVEPTVAVLQLSARSDLAGLDRRRLAAFAADFVRKGSGRLDISVGANSAEDPEARATGQAIAAVLMDAGVKWRELRLQLVLGETALARGDATLRFDAAKVWLPECNDWRDGDKNAPSANFGCSVQSNIGAMVANPQDLVGPDDDDRAASSRESQVIDKWGQGQATWSPPLPWGATPKSGGQ